LRTPKLLRANSYPKVIDQNVVDGLSVSTRGYVMENGSIVLQGASGDMLGNEQIRAAYLGL
jgi:branched-chain amino acid transport system ATP-binding protein